MEAVAKIEGLSQLSTRIAQCSRLEVDLEAHETWYLLITGFITLLAVAVTYLMPVSEITSTVGPVSSSY